MTTSNEQVVLLLAGAQQPQPLLNLCHLDLRKVLRHVTELEQDPKPGHGDGIRAPRVGVAGQQQSRDTGKLTVSQN